MYEPLKGKIVRTFRAFMRQSIADPAHIIAVQEVDEDGTTVTYVDADILRQVAQDIDDARLEATVRQKTTEELLKLFGISHREYLEKLSAKAKESNAA